MQNLIPVSLNNYECFEAIRDSKRSEATKTRLRNLESSIRGAYDDYWTNRQELAAIVALSITDEVKDDLQSCYYGETNALSRLKLQVRQRQRASARSTCQYCGIGSASTFDHYLPKELFPEFSVLPINLLPCCSECNGLKGTRFQIAGQREIVSLYFDSIPNERFLYAKITYHDEIPLATFWLQHNHKIDATLFARIETHYERLKLFQRFREHANSIISEGAKSFARTYCGDLTSANIQSILLKESQRLALLHSTNYWVSVLYESLALETRYIQYCLDS